MHKITAGLVGLALLSLGACGHSPGERALSGGAIGAGGGALAGAALGNPLAGAVVGGVAGAGVGAVTADEHRHRGY